MTKRRPIAIDLFSGVGGLGLGAEQAGFAVDAAFDCELFNVETHRRNFPDCVCEFADLGKASGSHLLERSNLSEETIDVLIGGPPCQGFSVGGKRDLDDKRNQLVFEYARLVREIRPRYFVMENVQGLLSTHSKSILDAFVRRVKRNGYRVVEPIQVLNAADYGVPQRRKRVFVLGYLKDLIAPKYPAPVTSKGGKGRSRRITVRDAIIDLPRIEEYERLLTVDSFGRMPPQPRLKYAKRMRGTVRDDNDFSVARSAPLELTGFLRTDHSPQVRKRFSEVPQGGVDSISRYIRLSWSDVAPTLRAGTGGDRGRHTAPRPIHPEMPRCITTREAARLHSFPDWFEFHGTRWNDFRQIGNSVPPLLARAVLESIMTAVNQSQE